MRTPWCSPLVGTLALVTIIVPVAEAQQDSAAVTIGARVRVGVEHYATPRFTGQLTAIRPDTLVVAVDANRRAGPVVATVTRSELRSLEVALPARTGARAAKGALAGVLGGVVLGALASASIDRDTGGGAPSMNAVLVPIFGALGALIGAVTGHLSAPERWAPATGWP